MSDIMSLGSSFRTENMFSHSEILVQNIIRKKLQTIESIERLTDVHFMDVKRYMRKLVLFISKRYEAFKDIALEFLDILWKIQNKCQTEEERKMFDEFASNLTQNCSLVLSYDEASPNFQREFFQRWSRILSGISSEILTNIALNNIESMQHIGETIFTTGHILTQLGGLEIFVKYLGNNVEIREEIVNAVIPSKELSVIRQMLITFDVNNFDLEARKVLNNFNMNISEEQVVYSAKAERAFIEEIEIIKPMHKGQEIEFWIDFNASTRSISFFCSRSTFSSEDLTWMYIEIFEPSTTLNENEYSMTITSSNLLAEPSIYLDNVRGKKKIKIFYNKTIFYSLIPGVKVISNSWNLNELLPNTGPAFSLVDPTNITAEKDERSVYNNDTESVIVHNQQRTNLSKPLEDEAEVENQIMSNFSYKKTQQPVASLPLKENPLCMSSKNPENISKDSFNSNNSNHNETNPITEKLVIKVNEGKEPHLNNPDNAPSDVESNEKFVGDKKFNNRVSSDIFSNPKSNQPSNAAVTLRRSFTQTRSSRNKKAELTQKLSQLNKTGNDFTQISEMIVNNSKKPSKNVDDKRNISDKVQMSSILPNTSNAIDKPKSKKGRKDKPQVPHIQKSKPIIPQNVSQKGIKELNKKEIKQNIQSKLKNEYDHSVKNNKDLLTNEYNLKEDITKNSTCPPLASTFLKVQPSNARSSVYDIDNLLIEDAREEKKFSKPKNMTKKHNVPKFSGENKNASFSYRKNKSSKLGYYSKELRTDTSESDNKSIKRQPPVENVQIEPEKKKGKKQPVTERVKSAPKRVSLPRAKKPVIFNFSQSDSSHASDTLPQHKKDKNAKDILKNKSNITENTSQAPETSILEKKSLHSGLTVKFVQNINDEDGNKENGQKQYHSSYDSVEVAYPSGNQNVSYFENLKNTERNCHQAINIPCDESTIYDKSWILNRYIQQLSTEPTLEYPFDDNINEEIISLNHQSMDKDNSSKFQSDIGDDNVDQESYSTKSIPIAQSTEATKLTENNGIKINLTYNISSSFQNHINNEQSPTSTRKRELSFVDTNLVAQKRLRYESGSSDGSQNYVDETVEKLVTGFEKKTNSILKKIQSEVEKHASRSNVTNIIANIFKSYFKPYKCYVKRSMESLQKIEELQNRINGEFEKFMELETFSGKQLSKMRGALLKIKMENTEEKHNKLKSDLIAAINILIRETNEASDEQWKNYVNAVANAYSEKIRKHSGFN